MAYVRKVRTTSGAVAVQVARKDQGKVVILAHLGSAHTDAELGILLDAARQIVAGGQAALDFEVAARAESMTEVPDFRMQRSLIAESVGASVAPVVPPGRNCQYLWIGLFQATSVPVDSVGAESADGVMSVGRSSSLPLWKIAPARTRATRCGALTARQRACAASISL